MQDLRPYLQSAPDDRRRDSDDNHCCVCGVNVIGRHLV
jgi:hypothetical protein